MRPMIYVRTFKRFPKGIQRDVQLFQAADKVSIRVVCRVAVQKKLFSRRKRRANSQSYTNPDRLIPKTVLMVLPKSSKTKSLYWR